ncbi:MAG: hypothetical protein HZA62_04050 [Rhodocyclales bacterium]|nr:hypothetical protein [Rhodocyclales bacterium]
MRVKVRVRRSNDIIIRRLMERVAVAKIGDMKNAYRWVSPAPSMHTPGSTVDIGDIRRRGIIPLFRGGDGPLYSYWLVP